MILHNFWWWKNVEYPIKYKWFRGMLKKVFLPTAQSIMEECLVEYRERIWRTNGEPNEI